MNASPQNNTELFYHFVMTVFYALLVYHSITLIGKNMHILDPNGDIPPNGGNFKFMVHMNQWFLLLFFCMQFLTDVLLFHNDSAIGKNLQKLCDVFFTTIAAPTSFFVALAFWTTYAYDRNLVFPECFDLFVPLFTNHFWHTTIVLWVVLESIVHFHQYLSVGVAVCINLVTNSAYVSWFVWIFVETGYWVYPVLNVLPLHYQALFCFGNILSCLLLYFIRQAFTQFYWGKTIYT